MRLTNIQTAGMIENLSKGVSSVGRSRGDLRVRVTANAYDPETRRSFIASPKVHTVPDLLAIRLVDSGVAEYVTEEPDKVEAGPNVVEEPKAPTKTATKEANKASNVPPEKAKVS
jgi:hypothetical protein